jgi:hypothetical protein
MAEPSATTEASGGVAEPPAGAPPEEHTPERAPDEP